MVLVEAECLLISRLLGGLTDSPEVTVVAQTYICGVSRKIVTKRNEKNCCFACWQFSSFLE